MSRLLGQLHALIDCCARRNAIKKHELISSHAQRDQDLPIEFGIRPFQQRLQFVVQLYLPAQHAKDERRCQVAVGC